MEAETWTTFSKDVADAWNDTIELILLELILHGMENAFNNCSWGYGLATEDFCIAANAELESLGLPFKFDDDGEMIASHPRLHAYGVGDTPSEALDDFVSMLRDLYVELSESEQILSRDLRDQLYILRSVLPRR